MNGMKKKASLSPSDRRKLEAQRDRLAPLVAEYESNGVFDTYYHSTLARVEAALAADDAQKDRGSKKTRGKEID